jgi:hypothetical protein
MAELSIVFTKGKVDNFFLLKKERIKPSHTLLLIFSFMQISQNALWKSREDEAIRDHLSPILGPSCA